LQEWKTSERGELTYHVAVNRTANWEFMEATLDREANAMQCNAEPSEVSGKGEEIREPFELHVQDRTDEKKND
jgi:hypothetical protein